MSGRTGILPSPPLRPARELEAIRQLVLIMGHEVDRAITRAVCGLVDRDVGVCDGVIVQGRRLRSLHGELRRLCLTTVLERDPAPGQRREALVLLHMAAELERAGDHCAEIARIGRELAGLPESGAEPGLARMAEHCSEEVREVLAALDRRVPLRAVRNARIEQLLRRLVDELAEGIDAEPGSAPRAARVLAVARLLERTADRVVTLAEDLLLVDGGAVELMGLPAEAATGR